MKNTFSYMLAGLVLLCLAASSTFALTNTFTPSSDTTIWYRGGTTWDEYNAGADPDLDNYTYDIPIIAVAYIQFDLSSIPAGSDITSAELAVTKITNPENDGFSSHSTRNDSLVTARFAPYGLLDAAGNTPQSWSETTLVGTNVGAELILAYTGANSQFDTTNNRAVDLNALESVTDGNTKGRVTGALGSDLVTLLQNRLDSTNSAGLVTFMLDITDGGNAKGYAFASKEYTNAADIPSLFVDYIPGTGLSNIFWTVGSGNWDINGTANWEDEVGGSAFYGPEVFDTGNDVTFEDTKSAGGSISVNVTTTVRPASITVDTANSYALTGAGAIAGAGTITKTGPGTLTLGTANSSYNGSLDLNGGTTVVSSANNLGTSIVPINFDGGTLQLNAAIDIATHPVTLNAGGGTIDVGANNVTLSAAIGNGGAGGLTKAGSGTLSLRGDNNYAGDTVVAAGTLYLASEFSAGISNSPVISVAGGATLDAGEFELYLNGGIGQKLAGSGTVDTGLGFGVIAGAGTFISPATNGTFGTLTFGGPFGDVEINGATVQMDVNTASQDQINIGGYLYLTNSTLELNVVGGTIANGTYKLIDVPFGIEGSLADFTLTGHDFTVSGQVAFLSDATPGQIDLVVAPLSNDNLVWSGVSSTWDVGSALSWLDGITPSVFEHGDDVTFDDSGSANTAVDLTDLVFPGSVTVNATVDYTISGSGFVSGTNALTKSGSGKLTVNTPNSNSGGTTINAGTVEVGSAGHIGTGAIVNDGTLILGQGSSQTSGELSGSGDVIRDGSGTVTLTGGASHTGSTTISNGVLQIGSGGAIPVLATSGIHNEGTLGLNTSTDINLGSTAITGTGGLIKGGSGTLQLGGAATFAATTLNADGGLVIAGSANQVQGSLVVQNNSTFDLNGFDQNTGGLESSAGNVGTVTNSAGTVNTLTVTVENGGNFEDYSGSIDGPIRFVKLGPDELILRGQGTMTGGAVLGEGAMQIRDADHGLGAGNILVSNATTFQFDDFPENSLTVVAGASATFRARSLGNGWGGPVEGSASSTLLIDNGVSLSANYYQFSNFLGTVSVASPDGHLRFSSTSIPFNGGENATFEVNGLLQTRNATFGRGVALGALTGDGAVSDFQSGSSPGTARYEIGAKGITASFTGTVADDPANNQFFDIVKVGAGSQTLGGSNNWSGTTTVSNGVLVISGAGGLQNNASITVAAPGSLNVTGIGGLALSDNQSLLGDGTVVGDVSVAGTNVTIAPGFSPGILNVTGNATLSSGATLAMELDTSASPTSDQVAATGTITGGGATVNVENIGPLLSVGQTFTLFNQGVSGLTVNIATNDANGSYVFDDRIATEGVIEVLAVTPNVDSTPTNIVVTPVPGGIHLEWPPSHTGWTLQGQTNSLGVGLTDTWYDLGYENTNAATFPVDADNPTVFYRLVLP